MSDVDGLRREIAEALTAPDGGAWWSPQTAADLVLPVVTAWAERQVAEALGEALGIGSTQGPLEAVAWMARRHAAALADDGRA